MKPSANYLPNSRLILFAAVLAAMPASAADLPTADGPFQPTMESLKEYPCPEWYRDAKFGIWAHWGPQAVPMDGDWYYNRNWKFRPVSWVIHMLVDNVSKNGNLLLNGVQRPDGSLDPEVEQMLEQLAAWKAIHGEAIFGSRPWLVYGQSAEGLLVTLPKDRISEFTVGVKITGTGLTNVPIEVANTPLTPDAQGRLTLSPLDSELTGGIRTEDRGGQTNLGFWDNGNDFALWNVRFPAAGRFRVSAACATQNDGSEFVVEIGEQQLTGRAAKTGGWDDFVSVDLGTVEIKAAGPAKVKIRPKGAATWRAINLRGIEFKAE